MIIAARKHHRRFGAGIAMSATRGKDRWWAVPAGGTAGALIGCQIDGG